MCGGGGGLAFFTLKVYQYQEWNTFNVKNLLEVFCLNTDQEKTEKWKGWYQLNYDVTILQIRFEFSITIFSALTALP